MHKLILLPNVLHEESTWSYHPPPFDALIAESEKGGYQFLKRFGLQKCPVYMLNEHTENPEELVKIPEKVVGLISDAGLPCLADPGARVVAAAHGLAISVETIPGPSSLIMALQLSGFSGQAFTFHGYFPREEHRLSSFLRQLDRTYTHLFIEAPYRTKKVFEWLLHKLPTDARLCVAFELMGFHSFVRTDTVSGWKKRPLENTKGRAVFLLRFGGREHGF